MKSTSLLMERKEVRGSYSPDADIVLYEGEAGAFLRSIPDGAIKLIISSPPYNVGKEYEVRTELEEYLKQQKEMIVELCRVLALNGSICWEVGNYVKNGEVFPLDFYFYQMFKSLDLYLRNRIIWRYGHGLHAKKRFSGRYETLLWFTKSDNYTFNLDEVRIPSKYPGKRHYKGPNKGKPSGNPKGKNPSNVWEIITREWEDSFWEIPNVKAAHAERTSHPAQFPIELVERCVLALTNEGDRVLDPYVGAGTSIIAAIKHNRKGLGSEKEARYVEIAKSRISRYFAGDLPYRPLGRPLYRPSRGEKVAQVPEEWRQESLEFEL